MLLHSGLGDDELRGDRPDRRRLGERIARQQRAAEGQEHIALSRRERRRLRDRGRLFPWARAAEQQAKPAEDDLVARVQGALANDPSSVDEGAVARAEVADAPGVAESLEDGMYAGDPVGVHDQVVRLEGSDGHSLGVQRSKLPPASAPHLDVAAHAGARAGGRGEPVKCRGFRDRRPAHAVATASAASDGPHHKRSCAASCVLRMATAATPAVTRILRLRMAHVCARATSSARL